MAALVLEARRPRDPSADDGFEVSYVPDDGAEHRVSLAQAWAVPLEQGIPVRRFRSRKGQGHPCDRAKCAVNASADTR